MQTKTYIYIDTDFDFKAYFLFGAMRISIFYQDDTTRKNY